MIADSQVLITAEKNHTSQFPLHLLKRKCRSVEKSLGVLAAADWTSTEMTIRKGQRVVITATGTVDIGGNRRTGADGAAAINDPKKLMADRPTGSLIAVIGDDNDDFIPIGSGKEFIATRDGILFLSVNEGDLRDNSGSFTTRVRVFAK